MLNFENNNETEIINSPQNKFADITQNENNTPKEKKKMNRHLRDLCIVIPAIFLFWGTIFLLGGYIINGFFSICSPKTHLEYVCTRASVDAAMNISDSVALINENILDDKTISGETEVSLESAGLLQVIANGIGLENTSVFAGYEITKDGSMNGLDIDISAGDGHIVSLEARADLSCASATVKIPEFSDDALLLRADSLVIKDFNFPSTDTLKDAMPSSMLGTKLLFRYLSAAYSCIDDIEREKDELTLDSANISENKTKLTLTISTDTVIDICETIIKKAEDDKDLEQHIIENSDEVADLMAELFPKKSNKYKSLSDDDLYDEIMDNLDDILDYIEDAEDYIPDIDYITLSFWIDAKGNILACDVNLLENLGLFFANITKSNKHYTEAKLYFDDNTIVSALGETVCKNDLAEGEFDLNIAKAKAKLEFNDVDIKSLKNGNLNGSIKITEKYTKISCSLECESDGEESTFNGSINYRSIGLCSISSYAEKTKAKNLDFHNRLIDFTEWKQIFTKEKADELIKKAGLDKIASAINDYFN